jgi:hypothetical protein
LNSTTLPSGKYLLDTLAKNAVALRDPAAAPSEKKVKLHGLPLDIGTVVLWEDGDLGWEADAIPANFPPQFAQRKFFDLACASKPRPNAVHAWSANRQFR